MGSKTFQARADFECSIKARFTLSTSPGKQMTMKIEELEESNKCKVTVEAAMTVYEATEHKENLVKILNKYDEIEIDLSDVSEMDTAGLQLLLVAKRSAIARDKQVTLTSHSQPCLDVIDQYALANYFGDQVILPSTQIEQGINTKDNQ